jgi:predicted DCC family thiol-disulfide oxidoreductase YuxK
VDTPPDLLTAAAAIRPGQKVLFYDGQCRWCCRLSQSSAPALLTRGIHIAPFPAGLDAEEVKLVRASGVITGGADAVLDILAEWPVLRPLARLGNRPRIHALLTKLYRKVAVSRHCLNGACAINARPPFSVRVIDTVIRLFAEAMSRIYPPERESGAAPS